MTSRYLTISVLILPAFLFAAENPRPEEYFVYDPADRTADAAIADNPEFYEIDIAADGETVWATWLEFIPGQGDVIWLGRIDGDQLTDRVKVVETPGRYARPLVTAAAKNKLYITYEAEIDGQWDIFAITFEPESKKISSPARISLGGGPDINHRTAIGPQGRLWIVWQGAIDRDWVAWAMPREGKFQIFTRWIDNERLSERIEGVSGEHAGSAWAPDLAWTRDGRMIVCWDAFDGTSYNIHARVRESGEWQPPITIAKSEAHQARPRVVTNAEGHVYIVWEEGGKNWGRPYTSRMLLRRPDQLDITDDHGPLHRFRKLHVVRLNAESHQASNLPPLPMPSFRAAEQRKGLAEGAKHLGVYYERPIPTFDDQGRLWVFYRHRYGQYLGIGKKSHVESDWAIDARHADGDGWSDLFRINLGQGDGMQSLALAVVGEKVFAAFTTGRTDRREQDLPRGVAWASLASDRQALPLEVSHDPDWVLDVSVDAFMRLEDPLNSDRQADIRPEKPADHEKEIGGRRYQIFFGDLHRHTDLSECYVPYDGTLDEAYRYGSDVAAYEFLGITDHSRDIAQGNPGSQLWWRSVKEVMRHDLSPRFIPMYAYERSRAGADHNVISLRSDMLRPHTYPHSEFWKELDNDTITIPHQTMTKPFAEGEPQPRGLNQATWNERDNAHRPLIEIYQGCRHRAIEDNANEGLLRHHLLGFIASSDHLSTSHAYACVWAEKPERETIFRAMQQRRTYGATAKIILAVTSNNHWMGEKFEAAKMPALEVEATGTDTITSLDLIVDGRTVDALKPGKTKLDLTLQLPEADPGLHYAYVRLQQTDGHRAWSSPIWIDLKPEPQARR